MSYPGGQNPYENYPQQPYGQQPYGQQPYGQPYGQPFGGFPGQDHPQATLILILGILSLVLCALCGPFAVVMGRKALTEIDASGGAIGGRGQVMAGYICGIIATALMVLAIIFFLFVAIGVASL